MNTMTRILYDSLVEGKRRRDEALNGHETLRKEWLRRARNIGKLLSNEHGQVTTDDIWHHLPIPFFAHPSIMGAVFKRKEWQCIGYQKSTRPEARARRIGVYRWVG